MKKYVALLVVLIIAAVLAKPSAFDSLTAPIRDLNLGFRSTKDTYKYQRKLEAIAPKGSTIDSREQVESATFIVDVILPHDASKDEVREFLKEAEPIAEAQNREMKTWTNIAAHIDGMKVSFSHSDSGPILTPQWERASELLPKLGDKVDEITFLKNEVLLIESDELQSGSECSAAIRDRVGLADSLGLPLTLRSCNGAYVSFEVNPSMSQHMNDSALMMDPLPKFDEGSSIRVFKNGDVLAPKENEIPQEAKQALDAWPHGKVNYY